jgi:aryl-alcohol dehydrogenase-like predicted oxidoreductase
VVTTKFGWVLDVVGTPVRRDSSPAHVRRACEASLHRLGTDHIDLYLQHRRDPETPVEATVEELVRLREEGKIRAFGFCEVGSATLSRAALVAPVSALQTEYSLWSREAEPELLPFCARTGIQFMAYSPLGRGFLTGKIRSSNDLDAADFRRTHPRFEDDSIRANLVYVDRLKAMAEERGHTAAQLALAWVLSRPWGIMPVVATRSTTHLAENARALEIELDGVEAQKLAEALPAESIRGARHPAEHMKTIES